jgi:hypothetical protein
MEPAEDRVRDAVREPNEPKIRQVEPTLRHQLADTSLILPKPNGVTVQLGLDIPPGHCSV